MAGELGGGMPASEIAEMACKIEEGVNRLSPQERSDRFLAGDSPILSQALLPQVRVMRLEPGDMVVLETPRRTNAGQRALLREQLERIFEGHRCIVLDEGMTLSIVSKEVADDAIVVHNANRDEKT